MPATFEILDTPAATASEAPASTAGGRVYVDSQLKDKEYFDAGFLALILSDVLEMDSDAEELPLPEAVERLDAAMENLGLSPKGDFCYSDEGTEFTCRTYTDLSDSFGIVRASEGSIEVALLTESADRKWIVTGLADAFGTNLARKGHRPAIHLTSMDEPLEAILAAHKQALASHADAPIPAPATLSDARAAYDRFIRAAFD